MDFLTIPSSDFSCGASSCSSLGRRVELFNNLTASSAYWREVISGAGCGGGGGAYVDGTGT